MDLARAAAFHLTDLFDTYSHAAGAWSCAEFCGKLGYAPESFVINDLSSRKRMLYTTEQQRSSVIRLNEVDASFMVEGKQGDSYRGDAYMFVYNLHEISGPAQIWRAAPIGDLSDPGWAINGKLQDTFGDAIFQRVPMDQEQTVNQYGLYNLYLPSDSPVKDQDTVILGGVTYFIFEVFTDQGLRVAKATNKPDLRQNIVYIAYLNLGYDPAQLKAGKTPTSYNVTAQVETVKNEEMSTGNVAQDIIHVLINRPWIPVAPKIDDKIQVFGKSYVVKNVKQNMIMDQWDITAAV